jgi:HAD superfamily hydrolase (TIGR01509 family)
MEWVLFLDDGGVMNDNALRGPQWQRLVGEFFPPLLGGTAEAWAEANRIVVPRLLEEYARTMYERVDADYAAWDRGDRLAWLGGMCERVGVPVPSEEACIELSYRSAEYITRRVRSAYPGAVAAIQDLHGRGYVLHTASGEYSADIAGYLEGMGVRHCFGTLYGPDLVNTLKEGPAYYARIFTHAGIAPESAVVVDDKAGVLRWAAEVGARAVQVGPAGGTEPAIVIGSLAELPQVIEQIGKRTIRR